MPINVATIRSPDAGFHQATVHTGPSVQKYYTRIGSQVTTGSSEAPPQHQATGEIIHSSGTSNNHFLQSGPQMLWHWQHYPDDKSQTTSVI